MSKPSLETGNLTSHKGRYTIILFAVLFMIVIALFHEFVFSDKMLYGSDTIQAGVFFRQFYVDYVHQHGAVPVWNPYQFCGIPYIDGFHGDTFYPFSILKFFINIYRALGWNLLLHVFVAGITMFACARVFGRSQMASTLAAVSYMFAAYFVSQVAPGHDGKMFVTTLFPLTIMLIELGFEKSALLSFSLLGLAIGIIILTPHPQMAYYSLWACAFYFMFKLVFRYRDSRKVSPLVRPSLFFVAAVLIGLAISAIHFYPGYRYVKNFSPRSDEKRGEDWAKSWSLHPEEAFSLIVPEFCGVSGESENSYWGRNAFKDNSEYAGAVPLLLAIVAIVAMRTRLTWFFAGLGLFALIYGLAGNTPFFYLFYHLIPNVKATRAWSMIMFLFSFSIALLAAFGLDFIIEQSRKLKDKESRAFMLALFGLPALVLVGAFFYLVAPETAIGIYRGVFYSGMTAQKEMILKNHLGGITAGFWITGLFLLGVAVVSWLYARRKAGVIILWAIIAIALVDAFRFDLRFIRTFDQNLNYAKTPLVDYFNTLPGKFRVLNLSERYLPTNYLPLFGIEEMTSYHGNQPRWYQNLLGGTAMKNLFNINLVSMTNTKYLLISPDSPVKGEQLVSAGFPEARRVGNFQIFENPWANERAVLLHEWVVEPDEAKMDNIILAQSFNPRRTVGLFEDPGIAMTTDSMVYSADRVTIDKYENSQIIITTSSSADGLLLVADNWYPDWKGFVDGKESTVHRANAAFRGIVVPSGDHLVELRYISSSQRVGRYITLAGLLVVGLAVGGHFITRKRQTAEDADER